jgi:ABC-type sugar transport system permease subunit
MKRKRRLNYKRQRLFEAYIFMSPFIVGCIAFFIFPLVTSIWVSLSDITRFAGFKMELIGLQRYIQAFVWDINFIPHFLDVLQFTLINTPLIVIFALFFSILINKKIRFKGFFRTIFFLPFLLGTGYIMQQLLGQGVDEDSMSVARGILFPREVVLYLGPRVYSTVNGFLTRITLVLWRLGVQVLLFLAGLQGISPSLYEATRVDGATEWDTFWKITLPMISPVILLNIVYTLVASFTDITNPLLEYIYQQAFESARFEYAAAMSWIYCLFIILLLALVFRFSKKHIYAMGGR